MQGEPSGSAMIRIDGPGVYAVRDGRVGRLMLDRPKALNALDLPMIRFIRQTLDLWRAESGVEAVVMESAGRAFCAGGDIRAVRALVMEGRLAEAEDFFAEEYALNGAIARYPKPIVSLIGGICMGGGLGISVHGSDRVVTEAAVMAMPETAIGLTPDIGASLCGYRLEGAEAVHAGLATAFVPSDRLPALSAALAEEGPAATARFAAPLPPYRLQPHLAAIGRCFGADSPAEIVSRLEAEASAWGAETLATLGTVSPSSVAWSLASMRAGGHRSLEACLAAELALVTRIIRMPDFAEGVRAMVVDKDRAPRWQPARIADVDPRIIAALMQPGALPSGAP
jgi:enoyl-CoA hydratase